MKLQVINKNCYFIYYHLEIKNKSIWSPHNYLAKIDNSITNNNIFSGNYFFFFSF